MPTGSVDGPRAKLKRAHEHLRILDTEMAAFYEGRPSEGQPYEIGSEFRADTNEYVFTVKVIREPPPHLGLLLGDYAHNLRAALDHLVCQLARLTDDSASCEETQFPIRESPSKFKSVVPTWLNGITQPHRTLIEKLQPYHTGEAERDSHFLNVIAWLDNVDKHRVIHPTFGYFSDPGSAGAAALHFTPNYDAGTILERRIANGRRIEGDTDIVRLTLSPRGPKPHVDMHGDLLFEPAFGDRWLPAKALPHLAELVEAVIDGFATDF